jgi:hypothetical protein
MTVRAQARSAAAEIASELRMARQLAMARRERLLVRFDLSERTVTLRRADTETVLDVYRYADKGIALDTPSAGIDLYFHPSGRSYLHPLDAAFFTTWSSLVFFPLLGLTVEAGVLGALFLTFNAMFQHANIKTPYWLGFIIQRPESHHVHHGRGIHRYNYADLPVVDMLFGTFRNPRNLPVPETGFYKGASSRILEMLIGRDVSQPRPTAGDPALPIGDPEVAQPTVRKAA